MLGWSTALIAGGPLALVLVAKLAFWSTGLTVYTKSATCCFEKRLLDQGRAPGYSVRQNSQYAEAGSDP